MAEIMLASGRGFALVDDEDYDYLSQWRWHLHSAGYAARSIKPGGRRVTILMHREIMQPPATLYIDHLNHDPLDNRRSNLRIVDNRVNQRNRGRIQRNNTSGVTGVSWHSIAKKWIAQSKHHQRRVYLGLFERIDDAAAAYQAFHDSVAAMEG